MKRGGVFLDIAEIVVITHSKETTTKKTPGGGFLPWTGGPVYIL